VSFLSAESVIKAAQEACEDLVLSMLFTGRCITECCNVLSDVQGTRDFSPRATVVLKLLILCLSNEESSCGIAKEQTELYTLQFFLLFRSCSFTILPKGYSTFVLVLQIPARMTFHKEHIISHQAASTIFTLIFFVPVHLVFLWFFDSTEGWAGYCKIPVQIRNHRVRSVEYSRLI